MNKEKQIEEMAETMLEESKKANVEPVLEMEGKEVVLGENATKVLNNILEQAFIPFLAEALYNEGYRKTSDVAREIDDLRRYIILSEDIALKCKQENGEKNEEYWKGKLSAFKQIRAYIDAELKKKYTEGGE